MIFAGRRIPFHAPQHVEQVDQLGLLKQLIRAIARKLEDGVLKKAGPTARTIGPLVLWEAMAMATQQHYLVEMNDRLAGIEKGVGEALRRMDDDKRGTLKQVHKIVEVAQLGLAEGRTPSAGRRDELRQGLSAVDAIWHQLNERVERHLEGYREGTSAAGDIEDAWAMLLFATQVLSDAGSLLTSLTIDAAEELDLTASEERQRVLTAVHAVRSLAEGLHAAHVVWSTRTAEYHLTRTRNPAKTAARVVRKDLTPKPPVAPLDSTVAWWASQLAVTPPAPAALLVTLADDNVVLIAERATADTLI